MNCIVFLWEEQNDEVCASAGRINTVREEQQRRTCVNLCASAACRVDDVFLPLSPYGQSTKNLGTKGHEMHEIAWQPEM